MEQIIEIINQLCAKSADNSVSGTTAETALNAQGLSPDSFGFDNWFELLDYSSSFDVLGNATDGYTISPKAKPQPAAKPATQPDSQPAQQPCPKEPDASTAAPPASPTIPATSTSEPDTLLTQLAELVRKHQDSERTSPPGHITLGLLETIASQEGISLPKDRTLEQLLRDAPTLFVVKTCEGWWKTNGQIIVKALKPKKDNATRQDNEKPTTATPPATATPLAQTTEPAKPATKATVSRLETDTYSSPFKLRDLVWFDNYDAALAQLAKLAPGSKDSLWPLISASDEPHPHYYLGLLLELNFGLVALPYDSGRLTDASLFEQRLSHLAFSTGLTTADGRPIFALCQQQTDRRRSQHYKFQKFEVR